MGRKAVLFCPQFAYGGHGLHIIHAQNLLLWTLELLIYSNCPIRLGYIKVRNVFSMMIIGILLPSFLCILTTKSFALYSVRPLHLSKKTSTIQIGVIRDRYKDLFLNNYLLLLFLIIILEGLNSLNFELLPFNIWLFYKSIKSKCIV